MDLAPGGDDFRHRKTSQQQTTSQLKFDERNSGAGDPGGVGLGISGQGRTPFLSLLTGVDFENF